MKLSRLITPAYLETQVQLHASPKGYGGRGDKWGPAALDLARRYTCQTVLDYGCGQGTLKQAIKGHFEKGAVAEYDPAIKGKSGAPLPADLVVCTDVLEHIEPDRRALVTDHLFKLTRKVLFVVIATRPSKKFLSDGRNAHLIIEPAGWWRDRMEFPGFEFVDPPQSPLDSPSREWVAVMVRK